MRLQADDIYVDGKDSSGLSTAVLKDRKILSDSGLVSVVVTIDSRQNKILTKPTIVSRGFVFIKDNQTLIKEAEQVVYEALNKRMEKRVTFGDIKYSWIYRTLHLHKTTTYPSCCPCHIASK